MRAYTKRRPAPFSNVRPTYFTGRVYIHVMRRGGVSLQWPS